MNVAIASVRQSYGFSERYLAANERFGRPFSLNLSKRGHYSEVNYVIAAMLYGLTRRRRLIVSDDNFDGMRWQNFYTSKLPDAPAQTIIKPEWSALDENAKNFWAMGRRAERWHRRKLPIWNHRLGLFDSAFDVARKLADAFCQPQQLIADPALKEPYAAIHIRRGDKIAGMLVNGKRTVPEAEDSPPEAFVALLRQHAPDVRLVWVMTDDFSVVNELRRLAPEFAFETMSTPADNGYDQADFCALPVEQKIAERTRLITETEVAIRSSVFIGSLKSNVGRFITLRHQNPSACFGIDGVKHWHPG